MAQSLTHIVLHLVFSTKDRRDIIPPEIEPDLRAYIAGICHQMGSHAYRVGGTANHLHIACTLPRTVTVAALLEEIKKSSSLWIKKRDERCRDFAWQAGYGAFSVAKSQLAALMRYIERQHEHHARQSFEEELKEILEKYVVEYDERYMWE